MRTMEFLGAVQKARVSPFQGGSDSRKVKPADKHQLPYGQTHVGLEPAHRGAPPGRVKA